MPGYQVKAIPLFLLRRRLRFPLYRVVNFRYFWKREVVMGANEDMALFEKCLGELVIKYEQYFLGTDKREPLRLLSDVEQLARRYQNTKIVNSMLNFRYNTLVAKLSSYKQNWNRINR